MNRFLLQITSEIWARQIILSCLCLVAANQLVMIQNAMITLNAAQDVAWLIFASISLTVVQGTILSKAVNQLHLLIMRIAVMDLSAAQDVARLVTASMRDSVRSVSQLIHLNNVNGILNAAQFAASKEFAWKRNLVQEYVRQLIACHSAK